MTNTAVLISNKTYFNGQHNEYNTQPMTYSDLSEYFEFLNSIKNNAVFKLCDKNSTAYYEHGEEYTTYYYLDFNV
jgi:hypothetical protein